MPRRPARRSTRRSPSRSPAPAGRGGRTRPAGRRQRRRRRTSATSSPYTRHSRSQACAWPSVRRLRWWTKLVTRRCGGAADPPSEDVEAGSASGGPQHPLGTAGPVVAGRAVGEGRGGRVVVRDGRRRPPPAAAPRTSRRAACPRRYPAVVQASASTIATRRCGPARPQLAEPPRRAAPWPRRRARWTARRRCPRAATPPPSTGPRTSCGGAGRPTGRGPRSPGGRPAPRARTRSGPRAPAGGSSAGPGCRARSPRSPAGCGRSGRGPRRSRRPGRTPRGATTCCSP